MTTLANVRAMLRRALEDTDAAAYLWADAELNDFLRTTLDGYAQLRPVETITAATVAAGQSVIALTAFGYVARAVREVTASAKPFVPRRPTLEWAAGDPQTWYQSGDNLLLSRAVSASTTFDVYACRPHTFPGADGSDFGLLGAGDDYLVWGAAVLALERREIASAKRRAGTRGEDAALRAARQTFREMAKRLRGVRSGALTLAE